MVKVKNKGKRPHSGKDGQKNTQAMQFNHALGQHILKNPLIVQALVDKVSISFTHDRISCVPFHELLIALTTFMFSLHCGTQIQCWKLGLELVT